MRGISEAQLKSITPVDASEHRLLKYLIVTECQELNQWQPIESAPKDRQILTWSKEDGQNVTYWSTSLWVEKGGSWIIYESRSDTWILYPTHWMELPPEPPK